MSKVKLETALLRQVALPGRYVGGEYNQIIKQEENAADGHRLLRFALCFPDIYELAMSNLAVRLLYDVVNREETMLCERVFAPWTDMRDAMLERGMPLFSLESRRPLDEFDCVGFSLSYEQSFPTALSMLQLGRVKLRSAERTEEDPVVVAGGPVVFNIEPMAPFFDVVQIGEGEKLLPELLRLVRRFKVEKSMDRESFLREAAQIPGCYVPSLYEVFYHEDGRIKKVVPRGGAPAKVKKRMVSDFDEAPVPLKPLLPNIEIVHDRLALELFRGCPRGCRFCQAGQIYRPVRERTPACLSEMYRRGLEASGYDEIGLLSLSTSDYSALAELTEQLLYDIGDEKVNLSVPSLRIDQFSLDLMERISKTRKSGLTFAPEAGTQRLRDVINKGIYEEDILEGMRKAYLGGYSGAKLYFMLGLPTETDEDVLGIAELVFKLLDLNRSLKQAGERVRKPEITVSTALFIPKPFTPFQWVAQASGEELEHKVSLLRNNMRHRSVRYNWHDAATSLWEAVLCRGDRRLAAVLEKGAKRGAYLDSWEERFDLSFWLDIMEEENLDPAFYAYRERSREEVFPWDHIDCGVKKSFLWNEYQKALRGELTPPCGEYCSFCGAQEAGAEICRRGAEARREACGRRLLPERGEEESDAEVPGK